MTLRHPILVTGAAGYIGAHTLVELIQAGHEVVALDDLSRSDKRLLLGVEKITGKKVSFVKADCTDPLALDQVFKGHGPFSSVIHFAAFKSVGESVEKPLLYYRNNVGSLVTLLEAMRNHGVHDLIFSSSCTVYGQPDEIPVDETAPFKRAESPYGTTKQICERILEDASKVSIRVVSLRYFNPVGAHPSSLIGEISQGTPNNLLPYVTQAAAGKRDELVVFGDDYSTPDGSCIRDFIHVVDLARAHVKACDFMKRNSEPGLHQVFNVGTGVGVSVLELITKFQKVTGVSLKYKIGPRRKGDIEKVYADVSKATRGLGWKSEFSLEDALKDAWNWEQKV